MQKYVLFKRQQINQCPNNVYDFLKFKKSSILFYINSLNKRIIPLKYKILLNF